MELLGLLSVAPGLQSSSTPPPPQTPSVCDDAVGHNSHCPPPMLTWRQQAEEWVDG
jgi:hypothetical protein